MGIQGNLSTMNVADLLQFLAVGRKTGMLKFDRGEIVKQIYFEKGLIVGSNSNDPKEYLGQLLIHYGKLDEAQLKAAMQIQRASGERLGEILISSKVLPEADVMEILRIRTLDIIYDLFLWDEAQFELHDNQSPPADLIQIEVKPTNVIMDGIYRLDEWKRYRTLVPSDRAILELGPGWTASLNVDKDVRQIFYFVEKRMSVAEICYNMHASPFHVYGQLYDLVSKGLARVAGEVPESFNAAKDLADLPETVPELLIAARLQLKENDPESAILTIQNVLQKEPKNFDAQTLLRTAEENLIKRLYAALLLPNAVPRVLITADGLTSHQLEPQEGFLLSRINDEWDVKSILSICPFREVDSLRMMKALLDRGIIGFDQ
ncbi:MAG TPA: hypothetical protein DCK93_04355 [Blastocatellia bacterium]|jgi:hypothetical protein|nr:hypothetical protein [Blastocatellia bacterium]